MRKFTIVLLGAALAFGAAIPASAAPLPSEIMEPYKAYLAAEKAGDSAAALDAAQKAYQASEKVLGDHKVTGDLAQNYADKLVRDAQSKSVKTLKSDYVKLCARSAELASFYPEDEVLDVKIQRLIKAAEGDHLIRSNKVGRKALEGARTLIDENGLTGSTYDGEVMTLESKRLWLEKKKTSSVAKIDKAIAILENPNDKLPSVYLPIARLHKASELKRSDESLEAALVYQDVMQNAEGTLSSDHRMVSIAFHNWLSLRFQLEEEGRLDEAEAAGICECWPYEDYKDKLLPLKRVPPKMPGTFEQGDYSGHVTMQFDVTDDARAENIKVVTTTSKILNKSAIESVEKWVFSKKVGDEPEGARLGVMNKITYKLLNQYGELLPEPG